MSNIFFVRNSLFRNAWGVPDSKEIHFGDLANLHPSRAFLLQNVHLRVLSKFLIQDFEPKEVPDSKKKLINRFGHEFCVRPEIFRSFGDVFGELSRIHFAKPKGAYIGLICTQSVPPAFRMNSITIYSKLIKKYPVIVRRGK